VREEQPRPGDGANTAVPAWTRHPNAPTWTNGGESDAGNGGTSPTPASLLSHGVSVSRQTSGLLGASTTEHAGWAMIEGEGTSTPRASLSTRPSEAGTQLAEEGSSDGDRRSETTNNPTPSADANPGGGVRVDGPKGQGHPGQSQGRQRHHQERTRTANDHM